MSNDKSEDAPTITFHNDGRSVSIADMADFAEAVVELAEAFTNIANMFEIHEPEST